MTILLPLLIGYLIIGGYLGLTYHVCNNVDLGDKIVAVLLVLFWPLLFVLLGWAAFKEQNARQPR